MTAQKAAVPPRLARRLVHHGLGELLDSVRDRPEQVQTLATFAELYLEIGSEAATGSSWSALWRTYRRSVELGGQCRRISRAFLTSPTGFELDPVRNAVLERLETELHSLDPRIAAGAPTLLSHAAANLAVATMWDSGAMYDLSGTLGTALGPAEAWLGSVDRGEDEARRRSAWCAGAGRAVRDAGHSDVGARVRASLPFLAALEGVHATACDPTPRVLLTMYGGTDHGGNETSAEGLVAAVHPVMEQGGRVLAHVPTSVAHWLYEVNEGYLDSGELTGDTALEVARGLWSKWGPLSRAEHLAVAANGVLAVA